MTNEQLYVLLSGMCTVLEDAIERAHNAMPVDAAKTQVLEKKAEYKDKIIFGGAILHPQCYELIDGDQFEALEPLRQTLESWRKFIDELKGRETDESQAISRHR